MAEWMVYRSRQDDLIVVEVGPYALEDVEAVELAAAINTVAARESVLEESHDL